MSYTLDDATVAILKTLASAEVTAAQAISDKVNALVLDPVDVAALQQQVADMTAL